MFRSPKMRQVLNIRGQREKKNARLELLTAVLLKISEGATIRLNVDTA
jgi:hypothetical protein